MPAWGLISFAVVADFAAFNPLFLSVSLVGSEFTCAAEVTDGLAYNWSRSCAVVESVELYTITAVAIFCLQY